MPIAPKRHNPRPRQKQQAWTGNHANLRRLKGRTLQKERNRLFNEQPLCVECLKRGREVEATIRDHIVPLAEGGMDTVGNTQALCQACHDRKTREEAKRGRKGAV